MHVLCLFDIACVLLQIPLKNN